MDSFQTSFVIWARCHLQPTSGIEGTPDAHYIHHQPKTHTPATVFIRGRCNSKCSPCTQATSWLFWRRTRLEVVGGSEPETMFPCKVLKKDTKAIPMQPNRPVNGSGLTGKIPPGSQSSSSRSRELEKRGAYFGSQALLNFLKVLWAYQETITAGFKYRFLHDCTRRC